MHYSEKMKIELARLTANIKNIERKLAKLPAGKLRFWKDGGRYKHFVQIEGKRQYIKQDQKDLITQLAKKTILTKMLQDAKREKEAIESYLRRHREKDSVAEYLMKEPHMEELVRPLFQIRDDQLKEWAKADYPSTAEHPEDLIHLGPRGQLFRSKSEAQIATILYKNRIPYRYEWDREINGIVYHIDFTIIHPKTGQLFFWEHFGMIDSESYNHKNARIVADFASVDIFPGKNLIVTCESKKHPLFISTIEDIVNEWFLN